MSKSDRWQMLKRLVLTVRYLKLRQVVYQLKYRLHKRKLAPAPEFDLRALAVQHEWIAKSASWQPDATAFTFLHETRTYAEFADWTDTGAGKLWLYNLHYFDYLQAEQPTARYFEHCDAIIADWISSHADATQVGWEPYPTSLRIVNWIKYNASGRPLSDAAQASLAQQAQWLFGGLEYHILANHLFANAKALVFAGMFFKGAAADQWRAKGLELVNAQLSEQILEDGGHFERSPMYHATLLEDVLDLLNLAYASDYLIPLATRENWEQVATRMCAWHEQMLHPDRGIAFFNDAAFDIAADSASLQAYATRLSVQWPSLQKNDAQVSCVKLEQSGYALLRCGDFTVLANVAPIGPTYQPGHAHADTLSCEVSIGLDRVLVNAGTSTYVKGPLRDWQRSTQAHNTVELNQNSSSDVWDGFRVARRATPIQVHYSDEPSQPQLSASHNGYRHLPGSPVHERSWLLNERMLTVCDTIVGPYQTATARWMLHPAVEVVDANSLRTLSGELLQWSVVGGTAQIKAAHWYPQFGVQQSTQCIDIAFDPAVQKNQSIMMFKLWRVS